MIWILFIVATATALVVTLARKRVERRRAVTPQQIARALERGRSCTAALSEPGRSRP